MRAVLILLALTGALHAGPIERVPYADLQDRLASRLDFETYPRRLSPGLPAEGLQRFDGATLGERFAGQRLSYDGDFDRVGGPARGALAVVAGPDRRNLSVAFIPGLSNLMHGLGRSGYPRDEATGEGAIAILFDRDQSALGLKIAAEPAPQDEPGRATILFLARDGTEIDRVELALDWGFHGYGFRHAGDRDVIAGIVILNADPAGIAIDDVIFDTERATSLVMQP